AGLVFLFARMGASVFHRWHTPTGNALFVAGLILLSVLAFLLTPGSGRSKLLDGAASSAPQLTVKAAEAELRPPGNSGKANFFRPLVSVTILLWLAAIVGGTELWYASNENKTPRTTLEISWPETRPGFKELPVPESVRDVLLSSSGRMATWQDG